MQCQALRVAVSSDSILPSCIIGCACRTLFFISAHNIVSATKIFEHIKGLRLLFLQAAMAGAA